MDIEITCSKCKENLWLSPEEYKNDGVDRWSVEPHICEAAEQSVHPTALRGWLWFSICVHIITGLVLLYSAFGSR